MKHKEKKKNLSSTRKIQIAALVNDVLEMINQPGPRIEPLKIAEDNNITWTKNDYNSDFLAMIEYNNGDYHIYIHLGPDDYLESARVRYSIAHELGHYFIPSHRSQLVKIGKLAKSGNPTLLEDLPEKEAEYFASCLLMPEKFIKADFDSMEFGSKMIQKLSKKYSVSTTALLSRYRELGKTPIMMVWSEKGKLKSQYPSKGFPFFKLRVDEQNYMPEMSLAYKNHINNRIQPIFKSAACADQIFLSSKEGANEMFYNEYCFNLPGSSQLLSVFWEMVEVNHQTNPEQA